jgi:hypothetical protein
MPRGYRCVIIALVGWLSLAATQQPAKEQSNRAQAEQVEPPAPYAPYKPLSEDPCYRSNDHDQADLCAQWRAAFAAEKAAKAAERSVTWTILGTAVSAIALVGLFLSLRQTSRALSDARANAYAELRAYVYSVNTDIEEVRPNKWRVSTKHRNAGKTPATDVQAFIQARLMPYPIPPEGLPEALDFEGIPTTPAIGPDGEVRLWRELTLSVANEGEISVSQKCIFARIGIRYRTYTGEQIIEPIREMLTFGHGWQESKFRKLQPDRHLDPKKEQTA